MWITHQSIFVTYRPWRFIDSAGFTSNDVSSFRFATLSTKIHSHLVASAIWGKFVIMMCKWLLFKCEVWNSEITAMYVFYLYVDGFAFSSNWKRFPLNTLVGWKFMQRTRKTWNLFCFSRAAFHSVESEKLIWMKLFCYLTVMSIKVP